MKAAVLNLEFTQRDPYSLQITFVTTAGVAIDYHLSTFEAVIRSAGGGDTPTTFALTTTSLATGILTIALTAAQTINLPRQCVWELRRDGTAIMRGTATVDQGIKV